MTEAPTNVEIARRKTAIRQTMATALVAIDVHARHAASVEACARIVAMDAFRHASTIMLYMPLATELDVTPLAIRAFQFAKAVCVPHVNVERGDMHAAEVSSFDDAAMEIGELGIRAPRDGRPVLPDLIDLVVVPGLAFDAAGYRLGRGKGYYDRFLPRLRRTATTVGIGFDLQIVDEVPVDEGDVQLDVVVTERRLAVGKRRVG